MESENYKFYVHLYFAPNTTAVEKNAYVKKVRTYIDDYTENSANKVEIQVGRAHKLSEVIVYFLPDNLPKPTPK